MRPTVVEDKNTTLWITGLNSDVTYKILFQSIRGCGRVSQVHINTPNSSNPNTCAAKVTFFTREAAQRLFDQARDGTFLVQGIPPRVRWNRYRTVPEPVHGQSRVLRILGPPVIVNRMFLEWFWSGLFYWFTDLSTDVGEVRDGVSIVWYHFANWKTQAYVARKRLMECFGDMVTVEYQRDPCGE